MKCTQASPVFTNLSVSKIYIVWQIKKVKFSALALVRRDKCKMANVTCVTISIVVELC